MSTKKMVVVQAETVDMLRRYYTLDSIANFVAEAKQAGIPGDTRLRLGVTLEVTAKVAE